METTDESVARVGNGLTASVTAGFLISNHNCQTGQANYTASCRVTVPAGPLFASAHYMIAQ